MSDNEIYLSIVVPVYNEERSVKSLHQKILKASQVFTPRAIEIIFVNDGSEDKTLEFLKELKPVRIINFRKNFGQTAAIDAGIKASRGRYIATMDGDGQNDPADIPRLLKKLRSDGLDLVSGWRKNRQDNFLKKICSKAAAILRKKLINDGIHDSGCTLKVYKQECFKHIDLIGEMHRFIPGLLKIKGFKVGELEVNHHPRASGQTKYGLKRGVKSGLDMVSVWFWKKYANRPLHLFGYAGIIITGISILAGGIALYRKLIYNYDLSDTALTDLSMFGFLIGIQFFVFGLLADILSKNYYAAGKDKIYEINKIIENK